MLLHVVVSLESKHHFVGRSSASTLNLFNFCQSNDIGCGMNRLMHIEILTNDVMYVM